MDVSDVGEESQPVILRPYHSRLQRRSYSFGYCPIQETLEEGAHHIPPALDLESGTVENEFVVVSRVPQLLVRASRNSFQHSTRPRTTIRTIQLQRHYLEDTASILFEDEDLDGLLEEEDEVLMVEVEMDPDPQLTDLQELRDYLLLPNVLTQAENTLFKVILDLHERDMLVHEFPLYKNYLKLFVPVALSFYENREFDQYKLQLLERALRGRPHMLLKPSKEAYVLHYQRRLLNLSRKCAGYSQEQLTV